MAMYLPHYLYCKGPDDDVECVLVNASLVVATLYRNMWLLIVTYVIIVVLSRFL